MVVLVATSINPEIPLQELGKNKITKIASKTEKEKIKYIFLSIEKITFQEIFEKKKAKTKTFNLDANKTTQKTTHKSSDQ